MKSNFHKSLELVLKHEGGFVDHPEDPGGATNKGITHKTYSDFLGRPLKDVGELKNIPDDHVQAIYKKMYWDKIKADGLPSGVDFCTFDWAVNSGPGRSARALQSTVGAATDGAIGPMTLAAVANKEPKEIIEDMHANRQQFYESLRTFGTFGKGWTRRNNETRDSAMEMII